MDVKNMTPEERKRLIEQLNAEERAEKERKKKERATYEELRDMQVRVTFDQLKSISTNMEVAKKMVFDDFATLLTMKQVVFGMSDAEMLTQQSHTFSTADNSLSIVIGHNIIDKWDETVSIGTARVNAWIERVIQENKGISAVKIIRDLMKPNKDGDLKANRVLELSKHAEEIGDTELIDAIKVIRDAYRPAKTSTFVKAKYKDELGRDQWLALSMSAI